MQRVKEESTCSFCGEVSSEAFMAGKGVICARCHYFGNVQMGKVPNGSIWCFACNTYSRFRAVCPGGTVDFAYCADDSEGVPIYIPIKCVGTWDRSSIPTKLECGSCNRDMPSVLMYLNNWTTPVAL